MRKERALNERAQVCGRALDSVESFSFSWATGSRLGDLRMTRALCLFSQGTCSILVKYGSSAGDRK